jgi:hypothetical protein
MRLDKDHLNQFEDIAPPMLDALSLPVIGKDGVVVYVCRSPFNEKATMNDVLEVAVALTTLLPPANDAQLQRAIDEAREALIGDSNDAEHDALVSIMEALGETIPEREDE